MSDDNKTHFGFATVDEDERPARVAGVFDSVATQYDLMNDVMSAGLHRLWKAFTVRQADVRPGMTRARHRRRHRRSGARVRRARRRERAWWC